ncbi:MAG: Ig-like domain-containing protein [Eubacterium sp.]|nr:Ig-like domain-containing protein [Eubacterium sp.]
MAKVVKKLVTVFLVMLLAGLFAPQAFAAELTSEQVVNYQDLIHGVAVMDDGIVYAVCEEYIYGFNASGTLIYSVKLPAKCGNLVTYGDYLFAAGFMSGHMEEIYVIKPGEGNSFKTLNAGQRVQAVSVDYDGNLYCVNSTGTRANGKKATKIVCAKISDVVSLSAGETINWTNEYQPDYTPPASDGNCYPQGIAIDGKGIIYIADRGAYNGYEGAVNGIFKYDPKTNSISTMTFTSGNAQRLFTWIYDICADDYGTVVVAGRNSSEVAVFRQGSTVADALITVPGYVEGVGTDNAGNVYFNASNNGTASKNGIYRINMNNVAVTGLSLSDDTKTIKEGETFVLSTEIKPTDATNKDVIFSSSDTSIASVDNSGVVTGVKEGNVTINVKTVQGRKTASCTVTVNKKENTQGGGENTTEAQGDGKETTEAKKDKETTTEAPSDKGTTTTNPSDKGTTTTNPSDKGTSTTNPSDKGTDPATSTSKKTTTTKKSKTKAANPLKIKGKTATVKYSKLKKKKQTLAISKVIKFVKKGKGANTYVKVSGNKKIKINKKNGKITLKKGMKKGTYKVKIKVRSAGNKNYKQSGWKKVTVKIKIK